MATVKCGNCGALVRLPDKSETKIGTTISKSSFGNYTLQMEREKENKNMATANERIEALKSAGVDVSGYFAFGDTLVKMQNGKPVEVNVDEELRELKKQINEEGDVFNPVLDGRWIMAQMFHMMNFGKSGWESRDHYTENLNRKHYFYQWDFLVKYSPRNRKYSGELYRLAKRERQGDRIDEKELWFNKQLIVDMIYDYITKLRDELEKRPTENCKGIPYIRLGNRFEHITKKPHGDIFASDLGKLNQFYFKYIKNILHANSYMEMCVIVNNFKRNMIPLNGRTKMSDCFRDAYKGNGAYYTLNNMIRWHNVRIDGMSKEESLKFLSTKADSSTGWEMLGLLREVIRKTNFKFEE